MDHTTHRLLSADEEIDLAMRMEAGRDAQQRIDAGGDDPALAALVDDGRDARETLILHNQRLVLKIARRFSSQDISFSFDDLVQEGMIGLMTAVDKFDWRRGHRFSTFATWWVRQAVSRKRLREGTISLPINRGGSQKSIEMMERARFVASLEAPIPGKQGDEGRTLMDVLPGPDDVEGEALNNILAEQLIQSLPEHHQQIVRDWMNGDSGEEAAGHQGMSRSMMYFIKQKLRTNVSRRAWMDERFG